MRWRIISQITAKEVLSTLRDRRAIVSNLLLPLVLLPVIMLGLPLVLGSLFNREQASETQLAVRNIADLPPRLAEQLAVANVEAVVSDDPEEAVRSESVTVGMRVPEEMAERLAAGEQVDLLVYSKQGNLRAEVAVSKVRGAIDATAGEKERGTLESLLVAPVRRSEVVVGKFLATMLFGLSAAVMAILGYVAGGTVLRKIVGSRLGGDGAEVVDLLGGSLQVTPMSVILLLTSTLLLAATLAALLLGVTMFARSFKEAQSYVAPLSFLLILPVMALQFEDLLDLGLGVFLVPVVNVLLLMDDTVKGAVEAGAVALTWGSLLVVIVVLLGLALHNFNRERVIFRT